MQSVRILCSIDETVVRDKCTPPDTTDSRYQQLPLHLLIEYNSSIFEPMLEVSVKGDCFRLFLRLYPASAGIKDSHSKTPYNLAVEKNFSAYFRRLLLSADPTIDPVERSNLNFTARKEGIFLAFRALSTNLEPTIWANIRHQGKDLLARVISYL
jgi:hypothetical protein